MLDEGLAGAVHHQLALLVQAFHRDEAHVGALHRLADRGGVGSVVLAALARHAVRRDKLRGHQPHGVAVRLEQPRPVVRTRTGLHADGARRQCDDQLQQPGAGHGRAHQLRPASLVHPVDSEDVLGEIDSNEQNSHKTSPSE